MSSCAAEAGLVAMDCLVVCCCCPCLVLQVTVFLFVRLPRRVVVKSKRVILRRWHRRRAAPAATKGGGAAPAGVKMAELWDDGGDLDDAFGIGGAGGGWRERCFAVVEEDDGGGGVWEALVEQEGLFWFGSFWGRTEQEDQVYAGLRLPVVLERVRD